MARRRRGAATPRQQCKTCRSLILPDQCDTSGNCFSCQAQLALFDLPR